MRQQQGTKEDSTGKRSTRVVVSTMFFHFFLILSCLQFIAAATTDPNCTPEDPKCQDVSCAECKKYSKDCVCEMVKPQYCVDGEPCKMFQRCIPREQSCSTSSCSPGSRCELHDVTCVTAPCWPAKECVPMSCPPNEEWRDCAAFCEPSCSSPAPLCPDVCKPGRCQCKEGFFRRDFMCVPSYGCRGITLQGPGG